MDEVKPVITIGKFWAWMLSRAMMKTGKGFRKARTGRYKNSKKQQRKK